MPNLSYSGAHSGKGAPMLGIRVGVRMSPAVGGVYKRDAPEISSQFQLHEDYLL